MMHYVNLFSTSNCTSVTRQHQRHLLAGAAQ